MHWRKKKKLEEKEKGRRKIREYFDKAEMAPSSNLSLANQYVRKARNIAKKHQIRIPSELKRRFCSHCYSYCLPGASCRIRLSKEKVVLYCFSCKRYSKYGYGREKSARKSAK